MTLTEKRRSKDMSLGELARACNLGTVNMSRIERGLEVPPDTVIADIARVLGWTPEEVRASLPSKEDAAKAYKKASDFLVAFAFVMEDAAQKGFKQGNGGRGEVVCPICKGRLVYSVASVNGHCWGKCSTDGCVSWMQ